MAAWKKLEECPEFSETLAQLNTQGAPPQLPPKLDVPKAEAPPRLEVSAPAPVAPVLTELREPTRETAKPVTASPQAQEAIAQVVLTPSRPSGSSSSNSKQVDELSVFTEMPKTLPERTQAIDINELKGLRKEAAAATKIVQQTQGIRKADRKVAVLIPFAILVVGLGAAGYIYLKLTTRELAAINGITDADFQRLKTAISVPASQGVRIEVAVSDQDPAHPQLHVVSNLPDGTRYNVTIKGVLGTLVRPFPKPATLLTTPQKAFHSSTDRIEVPAGEYTIHITEEGNNRPLAVTKLFLGGTKDANYQSTLAHNEAEKKAKLDGEARSINEAMPLLDGFDGVLQAFASARARPQMLATQKKWDDMERALPKQSDIWGVGANAEPPMYYAEAFHLAHEVWTHQKAAEQLYVQSMSKKPADAAKANTAIQDEISKARTAMSSLKTEMQKPHNVEAQ
jgi:hypothetical protein